MQKLSLNKNFEQNSLRVNVLLVDTKKQLSIPKEFVFTSFLKAKDKKPEPNLDKIQNPIKEEEPKSWRKT